MNIELEIEKKNLKKRPADAHKGDFGHVLLVGGGQLSYAGAIILAAESCLRSGAGKISMVMNPSAIARVSTAPKEIICYAQDEIEDLIKTATVVVLGPGLAQTEWSEKMFEAVMRQDLPIVLDADGLNILAKSKHKRKNWILTPHPKEAARLLGVSVQTIQDDRKKSIERLQQEYDGVVVLKGANTLVCATNKQTAICPHGNPGMASAGMGDILSGLIGGLLAQGLSAFSAAKLGVIVHAMAGDRQKVFGERGMIASDLFSDMRSLLN